MATFIGTDANNNITYQVEPDAKKTMLPNTGVAKFQDEIAQILETVTTYKGQPVVVTSAEDMTEETVIYLYMGEEEGYNADHWYYYDTENETWTDGGAYVANPVIIDDTLTQAGEAADAKVTGDELTQIKSDFVEVTDTAGIRIVDDFKHGIVTATATPESSTGNKHKYVLIPVEAIPNLLYLRLKRTVSYNILFKLSFFNASNARLYTDANWRKIEDGEPIASAFDARYSTLATVGITIVYSTTLSANDAITNVPLDDIYLENPSAPVVEDLYKYVNIHNAVGSMVGDLPVFKYGILTTSMTTPRKSINNKYVLIDLQKLVDDVYIVFSTSYYVRVYTAVFDANGQLLQGIPYATKQSGDKVVNKNLESSVQGARYVALTYFYSTSDNDNGKIPFLPEVDECYLRYGTRTLVERIVGSPVKYIVDPNGHGDFSTISDAVTGTSDGDTIYIMPGTYTESVHMWGKERHLIGVSSETCIVYSGSGLYASPAIEANNGTLENLTFISGNDDELSEESETGKAYAMHVEYPSSNPFSLIVKNCKFISALQAGVGIGCRYNQTILFDNCYIETKASKFYSTALSTLYTAGAALFHNDASASNLNGIGSLTFRNCVIKGAEKAIIARSLQNNTKMRVSFEKCLLYAGDEGSEVLTDVVTFYGAQTKGNSPYLCGTDVILSELSYGNYSNELDYDKYWI